jgi:hypothetical protein
MGKPEKNYYGLRNFPYTNALSENIIIIIAVREKRAIHDMTQITNSAQNGTEHIIPRTFYFSYRRRIVRRIVF